MAAPSANMYWRSIPWGSRNRVRVTEQGHRGTRYYVVTWKRKRYAVYWMGGEAADAQRALDQAVGAHKRRPARRRRRRK